MLKRLKLNNFTRFKEIEVPFSAGINVVVGANSTGKTHLLKAGYAVQLAESELAIKGGDKASNEQIAHLLVSLLGETFFPPSKSFSIAPLIRRRSAANIASLEAWIGDSPKSTWKLEFSEKAKSAPKVFKAKAEAETAKPIFIPAKEVLSMHKGLRGLHSNGQISIDRTYVDLCDRLDPALLIGPQEERIRSLTEMLSKLLGSKVSVTKDKADDFYLKFRDLNVEINLVSEGYRKIATLLYLLGNGSLRPEATLFWDEPEANLNPKLIAGLVKVLAKMANAGFQVIIATHSLFLMRELKLAISDPRLLNFIGLSVEEETENGKKSEDIKLTMADDYLDLEEISSLDAEVEQLNRQV